MRRRHSLPWLIAAVLLFGWTFNSQAQLNDPEPPSDSPTEEPGGTGHIFHIYISGDESSYVLKNVQEDTFCGIRCLQGTHADPEVPWLYESIVRVPSDKVVLIVEFESYEDYRNRLQGGLPARGASNSPPSI